MYSKIVKNQFTIITKQVESSILISKSVFILSQAVEAHIQQSTLKALSLLSYPLEHTAGGKYLQSQREREVSSAQKPHLKRIRLMMAYISVQVDRFYVCLSLSTFSPRSPEHIFPTLETGHKRIFIFKQKI